jgi:hypothetical protein
MEGRAGGKTGGARYDGLGVGPMRGGVATSGLEVPVKLPMPLAAEQVATGPTNANSSTPHLRALRIMTYLACRLCRAGGTSARLPFRWSR